MSRDPPSLNPYAPPLAIGEVASVSADSHSGPLAERMTRFLAALVDNLLYVLVALPGFVLLAFTTDAWSSDEDMSTLLFYAFGLPLPLLLACFQWYLVAKTGQSLAKRWFRIRIVRLDGSLPGFVHGVVLRSWLLQVLGAGCSLIGIVDAVMIFSDERRCLHDHIAGTKVIQL